MVKEELPEDKGWAWMVCGAVFIMTFLVSSSGQVYSVTLLDLVVKFDTTITTVSLMFMFQIFSTSIFSIVSASFLVPRFGIRRVCVLSTFVTSMASFMFSFSPSIYMCVVLAAIKGVCAGCFVIPGISIIGFYFKKYRSIATSLSMCGICCGSIAYPPLIRFILNIYGLQGTYMISSAIEANLIVASLLIRPINSYRLPTSQKESLVKTKSGEDANSEFPCKDIIGTSVDPELTLLNDNPDQEEHDKYQQSNGDKVRPIYTKKRSISFTNCDDNENETTAKDVLIKSSHNIQGSSSDKIKTAKDAFMETRSVSHDHDSLGMKRKRLVKGQQPSAWSLASQPSTLGIPQDTIDDVEVIKEHKSKLTCSQAFRNIFDFTLFKNWTFVWALLVAIPCGTNQLVFMYLPTIAVLKGVSKDNGALLLTIMGSVDLVSRLAIGVLADKNLVRISTIIGISSICLGIVCCFSEMCQDLQSMIVMAVFLGLFVGIRMSLGTVMFIEIVGLENMAKAFSFYAMFLTMSGALHNPLLGKMMETLGPQSVMYYLAAAFLIGGVMLLVIPLVSRVEKKCKKGDEIPADLNTNI